MNKLERAAMQQALDALEVHQPDPEQQMVTEAITALREALDEQAKQEPVACIIHTEEGDYVDWSSKGYCFYIGETPLYAAPVRTKDLTDADVAKIKGFYAQASFETIVRAAIAKFKEKNK